MCGIWGQIAFNSRLSIENAKASLACLKSRGPDNQALATLCNGSVMLGHSRLSIIDTSSLSNQPLYSIQDGNKAWIVFNGEIYNYIEIRKSLVDQGCHFKTQSDTEVLLVGYMKWGKDIISKLEGMYSFAIYSEQDNSLFVARDNKGIKPLYYSMSTNGFIFASNVSAILSSIDYTPALNDQALYSFLAWGFVGRKHSIYNDIYKLSPGHTIRILNNSLTIEKYDDTYAIKKNSIEDPINSIKESIIKSLELSLRSDVPVCFALSGGVDSYILANLASKLTKNTISTFSVGFDEKLYDESSYATQASRVIGSNHTIVRLNSMSALAYLPEYTTAFDEPFHINGLIPSLCLSKTISQNGFKVAIGGDGADELFIGYLWQEKWLKLYSSRRKQILSFLSNRSNLINSYLKFLHAGAGGLSSNLVDILSFSLLDLSGVSDFIATKNINRFDYNKNLPRLVDSALYLPDHCLAKVDHCSMNYGVEFRVPYLNRCVSEVVENLPVHIFARKIERKSLLKDAFTKELAMIDHNRKKGFSSPLVSWWKNGWAKLVIDVCDESQIINSDPCLKGIYTYAKDQNDIRSMYTFFSLALWDDARFTKSLKWIDPDRFRFYVA
jgi:asparagine synthase (glutamine-hydrolysing)